MSQSELVDLKHYIETDLIDQSITSAADGNTVKAFSFRCAQCLKGCKSRRGVSIYKKALEKHLLG
jgi:hypothetical protein